MDTLLYDISIPAISSLQGQLSEQAEYLQAVSVIFDPKYAFLIYAPIAFLIDQQVGKRLILTTVIAEWTNMILKWLLHGERPYWYVHSSGHFDPQQTPVRQFPITCELGPGHPSGHAMVTAAVWYIILDSLLQLYKKYNNITATQQQTKPTAATTTTTTTTTTSADTTMALPSSGQAQASIWAVYLAILVTVSVSRVFLGCHFPHQCVAGALLGFALARWISRWHIGAWHFIGAAPLLFASAFATYSLLLSLGFDPSWTIKLATKHCVKREYIHLDTAPFFSVMRYCGFALGTGLGLWLPLRHYLPIEPLAAKLPVPPQLHEVEAAKHPLLSNANLTWLTFKIVMAMMSARLVDNLGVFVSHAHLPTYYSSALVAYTLFSYLFTNL